MLQTPVAKIGGAGYSIWPLLNNKQQQTGSSAFLGGSGILITFLGNESRPFLLLCPMYSMV